MSAYIVRRLIMVGINLVLVSIFVFLMLRAVPGDPTGAILGQTVQPIRLLHGRLPILGFRLGDVAFCTDVSEIPDESWPLLQGLDTLVLDSLRDRPHPTHFCIEQSLAVIERVKPKRAYFTHISHYLDHDETNARLPAGVELGYDGLRIAF